MQKIKIAWVGKHCGEEPPLVGNETPSVVPRHRGTMAGKQGAGAIFFSGCNLACVFCQNWQISQGGMGKEYSIAELADIMLDLQASGAVNIDLVTPTIWWQEIKMALQLATRA